MNDEVRITYLDIMAAPFKTGRAILSPTIVSPRNNFFAAATGNIQTVHRQNKVTGLDVIWCNTSMP
jgi:hypothetical protein